MPDAAGLQTLAQSLGDGVLDTVHQHGHGTIIVEPGSISATLQTLKGEGYAHLMSVHGVDYYPEEPRLGVIYELLNRDALDRVRVKLRVHTDAPNVPSVTPEWPTADFQEREAYDMFGIVFEGHPDMRRILMPEDYEGYPQRRDFPMGGEPVLFTKDKGYV